VIDDWLLARVTDAARRDLLNVIGHRIDAGPDSSPASCPRPSGHAAIGQHRRDRTTHRAQKLTLKGPTMRDPDTRRGGRGNHDRWR
jgi:hypothetical protein